MATFIVNMPPLLLVILQTLSVVDAGLVDNVIGNVLPLSPRILQKSTANSHLLQRLHFRCATASYYPMGAIIIVNTLPLSTTPLLLDLLLMGASPSTRSLYWQDFCYVSMLHCANPLCWGFSKHYLSLLLLFWQHAASSAV